MNGQQNMQRIPVAQDIINKVVLIIFLVDFMIQKMYNINNRGIY